MTEIPGIVYLCMLVGWVAIGLAVVNAIFWHRNKGSGAATPKSLRRAWSISLASLLVPYLALISLPILGFRRLGGAAGIQSPADRTIALLALVNSCWAVAAGALFITWVIWFL